MINPGAREPAIAQSLALVEDRDSTADFMCALNVHTFLSRERKSISRESDAQLNKTQSK
jgi:hypothetical protein